MASAGRPRAFDVEKALDSALKVFWEKGYEGASMPELTKAMGINRPSLYAAFGNKEQLFMKVLDRYSQKAAFVYEALEAPTALDVAERLLCGAAEMLTDPNNPPGCLVLHSALSCGDADCVRQVLEARKAEREAAITQRMKKAKQAGDLPKNVQPADLSRYIATVAQGMAVQAASGATRKQLKQVVRIALRAWPV